MDKLTSKPGKIQGTVSLPPSIHRYGYRRFRGSAFCWLASLVLSASLARAVTGALGTTSILVGPSAGTNSVDILVIPSTNTWTAAPNTNWLHLNSANESGTGSTNVVFTFDANPGTTRSSTITIAGQTLTVIQAGSTYVPAGVLTTLAGSGFDYPCGVAVDASNDVYITDYYNNAFKRWSVASNTVTTLVSNGFNGPLGLALDTAGNAYIADVNNNAIKKWTVANGVVTPLVSSNLSGPKGVAVDNAGNVYIADSGHNAIKEWMVANSNVVTLVSSGLDDPEDVSVDIGGNVFITDAAGNDLKEWTVANSNVVTLVTSGLDHPIGVAVNGSGNVYLAGYYDAEVNEWTVANNSLTTLISSGISHPSGLGLDSLGNLYIGDQYDNAVKELPFAFVDPTPRLESGTGGTDQLPVVLPAMENLLPPFAPTTDQSWLTIDGITNGVVSFSFAPSTVANNIRTGHIILLGQSIPIMQFGSNCPYSATATVTLTNEFVVSATITDPGCGYTNTPLVLIEGGGGTGAAGIAEISDTMVTNVVITDAGANYSSTPSIWIGYPPSFTSQPQSQTVYAGNTVNFEANAIGAISQSYQWSFNGVNIPGATSSILTVTNVTQTNLGVYEVLASNVFGTISSSNAVLSMYPHLVTPFTGLDTDWGYTNTLSVAAWGTGPLTYQWFLNGVAVANATNSALTLADIQFTNAGLYSVVVSNAFGSVTNTPEDVVVNPAGISLGMFPGVIITGVTGNSYIIQRTSNLANTNSWVTVANVTLTQPVQLWVDTNINAALPGNPRQFYSVLPGQ